MIYARVHDRTVAEDYYAAMRVVEKRLAVALPEMEEDAESQVNDEERTHLLDLATQLAEPELSVQTRLALVDRICRVLNHGAPPEDMQPTANERGRQPWAPPQPSPTFPWENMSSTSLRFIKALACHER